MAPLGHSHDMEKKVKKAKLGYRIFKHYVRFLMDHLFYRKQYILGKENLPGLGEPFVMPANHQNTAMDPLIMLLSNDNASHPYVLAMGGVFTWHPLINKFWDWLGMLPAFRMDYEGLDSSMQNTPMVIDMASDRLKNGDRVIIYPEANHHEEHWMRVWQHGFLKIAFEAAEKMNWETDVKIIPTAHHYSSFYGLQQDYMIRYAEPISLKPYYERYQQKPRTVMRELTPKIREIVKEMILYTDDLEHHYTLQFVSESVYGDRYAKKQGLNPKVLPEKLQSDQKLWAAIEAGGQRDPKMLEELHHTAEEIRQQKKRLHIREHYGEKPIPSVLSLSLNVLIQLIMLPVFIFSLIPSAIMYFVPPMFMPGKEDTYYNMYRQAMIFIINVVLMIPVFSLTALLVMGLHWGMWWQAVVWIFSWYPLAFFAWYWGNWMRDTWDALMLVCHRKEAKNLQENYKKLFKQLAELLR